LLTENRAANHILLLPPILKLKTNKMKKITIILSIFCSAVIFSSCGNGGEEKDLTKDSLKTEIGNRDNTINEKEEAIQEFVTAFNEISANLDEIKKKEKILSNQTSSGDVKSKEEQIKADITAIYELLGKNKARIGSLNKKLKSSDLKISGLEELISNLQRQVDDKDIQIGDLKNKIESLNIELGNIEANLAQVEEESNKKTEKLNTAYYCMGTGKELKEKGVTTKEGGMLGMGKVYTLKSDFNKDYFTKVDVSTLNEITISAKKAKVLTSHPSSSFKIVGDNKKVEKIEILNPEEFWSASKYLVIITE
jgi:peptidoglycan hydrolase CwlO-like protein